MTQGTPTSVHRFSHEAMATVFEVRCDHDDARYAGQAAAEAFALVDRLEQQLSRFIANSDVSRVNALAAGEATRVSPWTLECLTIAARMHEVTAGAFDVSLGSGLDALELDPDAFTVRAHAGGVSVDLGGIGKGYAVDRVVDLLDEWELSRVLVHGGFSSVRAGEGPRDGEGWPLALRAPGPSGAHITSVTARLRAFSASGTQKGAHIRDPRDGRPAPERVAWVAVPTVDGGPSPSALAETLSTAFMLLSPTEIESLCGRARGLEAWVVLDPLEPAAAAAPLLHLGRPPGTSDGPIGPRLPE